MLSVVLALLAYSWLYLILQVLTPGQITFTEAALTLLGFPISSGIIWLTDRNTEAEQS
jgi:hypothetical protein